MAQVRAAAFFPRRRGWSERVRLGRPWAVVLPAQAGVVRCRRRRSRSAGRSSRAGGGGPHRTAPGRLAALFFPRRRGWSAGRLVPTSGRPVLPAQAGVVRRRRDALPARLVLPAQAGVVRGRSSVGLGPSGSSRAGGGGPHVEGRRGSTGRSSRAGGGGPLPDAPVVERHGSSRAGGGGPTECPDRRGSSRAGGGGPDGAGGAGVLPRRRGWSERRHRLVVSRAGGGGPTAGGTSG